MTAETKKAPGTPMPGTTTEAAPTAPTNTESSRNETDMTMIASPTDTGNALDYFDCLDQYEVVVRKHLDRKAPSWVIDGDEARHSMFDITVDEAAKQIRVAIVNPAAEGDAVYTAREIQCGEYAGCNIDADVLARELTPGQRVLTLKFGHTARAVTCNRAGCKDEGGRFREGDHNCEHALAPEITEQGIGVFYDLDAGQWAIDLEPAAQDYFTGAKATQIARALVSAGAICDDLNGSRRPIDFCSEV